MRPMYCRSSALKPTQTTAMHSGYIWIALETLAEVGDNPNIILFVVTVER